MKNRLKNQTSPYLLQHASQPVDWYPWGDEAFAKAKREEKPIFLSVGYSTCHWCHVMAHECFENEKIASVLNRYFVSIKVDREERPDIDSVYMAVCQAFTGSGGWPMSIFMTAEQKPFFAGAYFPPETVHGRMGFFPLLLTVAAKWETEREKLLDSADYLISCLHQSDQAKNQTILDRLPELAAEQFNDQFDSACGGFGPAPKFPLPHNLIFLMLYALQNNSRKTADQALFTLERMRRGGIYDQIGYGFSRYSTDRYFLVPHFEKMLYDNALLIISYAAAYCLSGKKVFLDTARETAEYVCRELGDSQGGFYSAQDADSEGEEGKFYVFRKQEILAVLGEKRGNAFLSHFGMTEKGNFEGKNIPNLLNGKEIDETFDAERKLLYTYRKSRAALHLDDKILTAWNSLMICALSVLYRVTGENQYLLRAQQTQLFIESYLSEHAQLYVGCRNGVRTTKGFLDDYACYTAALLCLYEADEDAGRLKRAEEILYESEAQFGDNTGGYFLYGAKNGTLITRPKETFDGALPSGNSVMAYCLVRLSQLVPEEERRAEYRRKAERQLAFLSSQARQNPTGYGMFLTALLYYLSPPKKITVVTTKTDSREKILSALPLYADVKILTEETGQYQLKNNKTTYYICENNTCRLPTNEPPCTAGQATLRHMHFGRESVPLSSADTGSDSCRPDFPGAYPPQ